jgi:hypothetical protein
VNFDATFKSESHQGASMNAQGEFVAAKCKQYGVMDGYPMVLLTKPMLIVMRR